MPEHIDLNLDDIELDEELKDAFIKMPREEQLFSILSMQAYLRRELAIVKKRQIDFETDYKRYRNHRERREKELIGDLNEGEDGMSITQKVMRVAAQEVAKAFAQRFDVWVYFRDRVLPTIITGFILALLYIVYGRTP